VCLHRVFLLIGIKQFVGTLHKAVLWLRPLVVGLSPRVSGFSARSFQMGFGVDRVAVGKVFSEYFGFPLSLSFHQCSILIQSSITYAV